MIYEFGSCELDTALRQVSRNGVVVHIEPQVFDLLCYLIERRDRAVTKDEIFTNIWGGRAVSDAVLTTRIRSLRKVIDDEDDPESKIRTLHRIGYQFRAPVAERTVILAWYALGIVAHGHECDNLALRRVHNILDDQMCSSALQCGSRV